MVLVVTVEFVLTRFILFYSVKEDITVNDRTVDIDDDITVDDATGVAAAIDVTAVKTAV